MAARNWTPEQIATGFTVPQVMTIGSRKAKEAARIKEIGRKNSEELKKLEEYIRCRKSQNSATP